MRSIRKSWTRDYQLVITSSRVQWNAALDTAGSVTATACKTPVLIVSRVLLWQWWSKSASGATSDGELDVDNSDAQVDLKQSSYTTPTGW